MGAGPHPHTIAVDDDEQARIISFDSDGPDDRPDLASQLWRRETDQNHCRRGPLPEQKDQGAKVGIEGDKHTVLLGRQRQNRIVCSRTQVRWQRQNIVAPRREREAEVDRNVLVEEKP